MRMTKGNFTKGMMTGAVIGSAVGMFAKYAFDTKGKDIKRMAKKTYRAAEGYINSIGIGK